MMPTRRTRLSHSTLLGVALALLTVSALAKADDYRLNRAPPAVGARGEDPYEDPRDPKVCAIYLENLRYFARRKTPMSCERPIAPHLRKRIQKVEWEDLDPAKYASLFRDVLADRFFRAPADDELALRAAEVHRKEVVFRRAKLNLKGFPVSVTNPALGQKSGAPVAYHVVQYGADTTDPGHPNPDLRCKPTRGGDTGFVDGQPLFYVATADLQRSYGHFSMFGISTSEHLRHINGDLYLERLVDASGDIRLTEIRPEEPNVPVPVCLFEFRASSAKRR